MKQQVVNWSRIGLGHVATVVSIPEACGAYHFHADGPHVDAGREFFSVVSGSGRLFVQSPQHKIWKEIPVGSQTVGTYPGSCGHCFVNFAKDAGNPLRILIVAIPFPPSISDAPRMHGGKAEAAEFRLSELRQATIPSALRQKIDDSIEALAHAPIQQSQPA